MKRIRIYHNPRCTKSRETLAILNENNVDVEVIEYLKTPPSKEDLTKLLNQLHLPVKNIIRTEEKLFKENYKGLDFNDHEWIQILVDNPVLIQRPIIVRGNKAIIGRPPERVHELL